MYKFKKARHKNIFRIRSVVFEISGIRLVLIVASLCAPFIHSYHYREIHTFGDEMNNNSPQAVVQFAFSLLLH